MKQNKAKTPANHPPPRSNDSHKLSPSTASPNSPGHLPNCPFKSCEDLWSSDLSDPAQLAASLAEIEQGQEEMRGKFDRMVEFLGAQISRNKEENRRLAEEVGQLSREVRECGEDIRAIEAMLRPAGRAERGQGDSSAERNHSRLSSSSASRRLLLSSRSNERPQPPKRISRKLFMPFANP